MDHAPDGTLLIALTTAPDEETADRLARALVEERLIACANLATGVSSIFRWEGSVSAEREVLMVLKTRRECVARLERRLPQLHPYEVPELIFLPVTAALDAYRDWVVSETTGKEP
jgi:periplasmic divalent cation tolerance protein